MRVLLDVVGSLLVLSFAALAAYALAATGAVVATWRHHRRAQDAARDLDRVLNEVLGRAHPSAAGPRHT